MPDRRLCRRTFLTLTATTAAIGTLGATTASASAPIDRAAGPVGDRALALRGGVWVLADDSSATPTRGLDGAEVVAVAADLDGYVAVGSLGGRASIWESPDGTAWTPASRRNDPHAAFTAAGSGPAGVLVLGSLLSQEGTPVRAVAAIRTRSRDWLTLPVRGLADHLAVTAVTGDGDGWTAAAVDIDGSHVHRSPDGITWAPGGSVPASAVRELVGDRWTGNAIDDTAPVRGVIGGGREVVAVPRDAHAVGGGFWLTGGALVRGPR